MPDYAQSKISGRLDSIDALRGFDMFWIIGGSSLGMSLLRLSDMPWAQKISMQFEHSGWNGFTFEDLIFPLFLFIVGLVLPFSLSRRIEKGSSKAALYRHICTRTTLLLLFGLMYNLMPEFDFKNMRYAGVLQRIALCYFFASMIVMHTKIIGQTVWFAAILVFYYVVMTYVPVPGHGAGILTPEGNLASYIDRLLLPGSFCCFEFGDNEGILSTIPAVSTTLLGVLAGHFLRSGYQNSRKPLLLLIAGLICIAFSVLWNPFFPVNKLLWSSSYVLLAGGYSLIFTAFFYWLIDIKGHKKWAFFFVVIGMNPITIYLAQEILFLDSGFRILTNGLMKNIPIFVWPFMFVVSVMCLIGIKWMILYVLYKRKIFLRV